MWLFRIAAVLLCICAFDAAFGSARAPLAVFFTAIVAAALATLSLALLWDRPKIATLLELAFLCGAFAAAASIRGTADGSGALAFGGSTPGDSAAAVLALVFASTASFAMLLSRPLARVATVVIAAYVLVPTSLCIGHGGLRAALADGPLAASRGTYAGILIALPLAAVAFALTIFWIVRRRGLRAAFAGSLAFSLVSVNQMGSVVAADAGLPAYTAYRAPAATVPALASATSPEPATSAVPSHLDAGADAQLAGLGRGEIDAGDASGTLGSAPVAAVGDAISALSATQASPSAVAAQADALRSIARSIPEREYSLNALAASLPDDVATVYAFVRDEIDIDPYDGVLRGALGTWLGRAGSPSDKALLLAWLLTKKHHAVTFVRGTLSDEDRRAIANVAPHAARRVPPDVTAYFDAIEKKSVTFATWSQGALASAKIPVGAMPQPFERTGTRHFWLRVDVDGKPTDLDPTIPSLTQGRYLGRQDATFAPAAALPQDEYHHARFDVVAHDPDGHRNRVIMTYAARIADIAYSPVRLGFGRHANATTFDGALQVGSHVVATASVRPGDVASVTFEIVRAGPGFAQRVDRRWILAPGGTPEDRADQLQSLVSLLVTPGRGANAFSTREQFITLAEICDDRSAIAHGTTPPQRLFYPIRIADFFVRDDVAARRAADGTAVALVRSHADIALQQSTRAGSDERVRVIFDIVDNAMSSLHGEGADVAGVNLARGYADTQLERDVTEEPNAYGTIALFDNAGAGAMHVVRDATAARGLRVSTELRDGLEQTFASGQVALAPTRPVALDGHDAFGWWAIDPVTGDAVGRMTGARGTTAAEYAAMLRMAAIINVGLSGAQVAKRCSAGSAYSDAGCTIAVCGLVVALVLGYSANAAGVLAQGSAGIGASGALGCTTADLLLSP